MEVCVFLVEDQGPMQVLMADLLHSVGGRECVGTAATETGVTDWLSHHRGGRDPVRVVQAEPA